MLINYSFLKRNTPFLILLIVFLLLTIGSMLVYKKSELDKHLSLESEIAGDKIVRMNKHSNVISNLVFENIVNQPEIIDIFKDAHTSNDRKKDQIRKELYLALDREYSSFTKYGIQQLHFHLPNIDSFLRFHRPEKYGDNLKDVRKTIVYVSEYQKPTFGFEEGRIFNGFRYVYPLFFEKEYIGSVEISHSSRSFELIYEDSFNHKVDFAIRRDIVESKVFDSSLNNYYKYPLNDNFLLQRGMNISDGSLEIIEYLKKDKDVIENMNKMKKFSTYVQHKEEQHYDVVSFVPIKNRHSNKKVAYVISYKTSPFLKTFFIDSKIQLLASLIISIILSLIISREINIRLNTKMRLHSIQEHSKKDRVIFDSSNDMIVVSKKNIIIDANKKFLTFYNKNSIDDLESLRHSMHKLFVIEDECFSLSSEKEEDLWIEKILELDEERRVVCILDTDVNKRYFHLHLTSLCVLTSEWLIIFSEITEIRTKHKVLEKQAYFDSLTQVYNRHYFMENFSGIYSSVDNRYERMSLIMLDIDHFKSINDTYGHDVGDVTLKNLAELIKANIRDSDLFARWGGEEFMLLVESNLVGALKISEHIRVVIEKSIRENSEVQNITCSFGVALLSDYSSTDEALKAVDINLYKAKESGRNKVIS